MSVMERMHHKSSCLSGIFGKFRHIALCAKSTAVKSKSTSGDAHKKHGRCDCPSSSRSQAVHHRAIRDLAVIVLSKELLLVLGLVYHSVRIEIKHSAPDRVLHEQAFVRIVELRSVQKLVLSLGKCGNNELAWQRNKIHLWSSTDYRCGSRYSATHAPRKTQMKAYRDV